MKISKVKQNNQKRNKLVKQGKLKTKRNRTPKKQRQKQPEQKRPQEAEEESDNGEDLLGMVEKDDLAFLQNAISNKSYSLLQKMRLNETDDDKLHRSKKKKKRKEIDLEQEYEDNMQSFDDGSKRMRMMLPVKNKDGTLEKRVIMEDVKEEDENEGESCMEQEPEGENEELDSDQEPLFADAKPLPEASVVSTAELLACREEVLKSKRYKIGILASGLLESPEFKVDNLVILLEMMDETNPEVCVTVKKLATISLLEVFKDLLPSYQILQIEQEGVRLKKDTLKLQNYEAVLVKHYKNYLQKLEKKANCLRKKKGDTRKRFESETQLGVLAVTAMCDLLVSKAYFNFSSNIANFLVPFLDNRLENVRTIVKDSIARLFREDKRGDLSLAVVRRLNKFVKSKSNSVHSETLSVLLSLRIKEVDLDKEKQEESKQKKLMSRKQRILALSKRERKRDKKLKEVEKEMLETKAEENKQAKQKTLTEITSIVFTIYFRTLKQMPNKRVLSVCLEGLAKFAHCINLEFYQDLVNVLNGLMHEGELGLKEELHCIHTVFTILSGEGLSLNIDPHKFYCHLYKLLLKASAAKNEESIALLIRLLYQVLVERRKVLTRNRQLAFVKRSACVSLTLQHHGALGVLSLIRNTLQLSKGSEALLDTEEKAGDGSYRSEVNDPEHCNPNSAALWELAALQRHYHSTVQKFAKNIVYAVPTTGEGSLPPELGKLSPEQICIDHDPHKVVFKPAIPAPKAKVVAKKINVHHFANSNFEEYVNNIFESVDSSSIN